LIRLAPTPTGALDLCFGNLRQVPLEDLVLAAVVIPIIERKAVLSLVLFFRDQPRPFQVAATDVDFEAFGSQEDSPEASLRVLLGTLGNRHSDLLISRETGAFLRGTPVPQVQEMDLASRATSWLVALDPRLEAEHPLLPETIETPQTTPNPKADPSSSSSRSKQAQSKPTSSEGAQSEPLQPAPLGPLSPFPAPPLLPPFGPSLAYGTDRLNTVTRGLGEAMPKIIVSARRRGLLLLTAIGMVVPGLLYLSTIGALGHAAYRYASRGIRLLEVSDQGERLWNFGDLAFVIPMAVCLLFLLTLLEPLFVRRPPPPASRTLERAHNTVLFNFVDRLARTVDASLPKIIDITTDADLGLHRRARRQGGGLVLTLGLPLVAGLNLEQFAGLLIREFTAFIRRPENILVRFVRWTDDRFDQLLGDCTDLQEKRRSGVGRLAGHAGLTPLVDVLLFLVFGLTRTLISLLARISTTLRRLVERDLAKDASIYQEHLVGGIVTTATQSWAATLQIAQRRMVLGFDETHLDAPPPDHLPAQVVFLALEERAIPDQEENLEQGHETPPRFRSTLPATALFQDFAHHAHRLTSDFYRAFERPRFELEPFATYLEGQGHLARESKAAQRFFGGAISRHRALPVATALRQDPRELRQQVASLATTRQRLTAALPAHRHLLTQFDRAAGYREAAREAHLLMSSGLTLEPQEFGLKEWTLEAAKTMENTAISHMRQAQTQLKEHEMRAGRCLMATLNLVDDPKQAARLGAADWASQAPLLLSAIAIVNRVFPHFLKLSNQTSRLLALQKRSHDLGGIGRQRMDELLHLETAKLEEPFTTFRQALLQEKDLFHHHGFDLSLAIQGIPADLPSASQDVLRRVRRHYRRCLSRLAWMAEQLEQAVGLPSLPEAEGIPESRPWDF
jgi:hypothetical protein